MLFSLWSMVLFSASTAASPLVDGPVGDVPALPVVTPAPEFSAGPDELAVPVLLVPDGGAVIFAVLPTPLGSFTELLRPPALAGPGGTPLTPEVPAPAEPALGDPPALAPVVCAIEPAAPARIAIATIDAVTDNRFIEDSFGNSTTAGAAGSAPERFPSAAIDHYCGAEGRSLSCAN
jgi:hypothetical protein